MQLAVAGGSAGDRSHVGAGPTPTHSELERGTPSHTGEAQGKAEVSVYRVQCQECVGRNESRSETPGAEMLLSNKLPAAHGAFLI